MQTLQADSSRAWARWRPVAVVPFERAMVLGAFAMIAAPGPCVTCRWASGDGVVFECELRTRVTRNEGCAAWEREPGAD